MRKKLLITFCVIAAAVLFAAIGYVIVGDQLTLAGPDGNDKIYIGIFEELSGNHASLGKLEALGFEYARTQRPSVTIGGQTYDLAFVTADADSDNFLQAFEMAEISAVLGSPGGQAAEDLAAYIEEKDLPWLTTGCASQDPGFRLLTDDEFRAGALASFSIGKNWLRAAVIKQPGNAWSETMAERFTEKFTGLGGETIALSFTREQINFSALIGEFTLQNIDCVFLSSSCETALNFITQAREAGLDIPFIGGANWDCSALFSLALQEQQVFLASPFRPDAAENIMGAEFAGGFERWVSNSEEREEQNGSDSYVSTASALAYDTYMLLLDAMEARDSLEADRLYEYFTRADLSGVTGQVSLNPVDTKPRTAYIKMLSVSRKEFEVVQTYLNN
jgi:branched-chain amino acid transport system substrate-binding protein